MNIVNINKKVILFLLFFSIFYYADFCYSAKLELKYPTSQSGISITDTNTPLPIFLQYIFEMGVYLGLASAVYSLGYAGVLYLRSGAQAEYRSQAKDRIWGAVSGILILAMTYLIITTLNPQLAIFKIKELDPIPPVAVDKSPGVYFYKSDDCSGQVQYNNSSINDFGDNLNSQIGSVLIVNDNNSSFISTMYASPGLFGKCQDPDPNIFDCQKVEKFASSASVHKYDFEPQRNPFNDGVYFYRKSFFNDQGGWLKIDNQQIQNDGFFGEELKNLTFQDVPIEDKVCVLWDEKGQCTKKSDPTLAGKEISSIKIAGHYIVYFVYFDPTDKPEGPWSYCQEFPTPNDVNKDGPQQIKWEKTPNQPDLPNWVYIYPVKD